MENIRFRPLVDLLRRVNDLLEGRGKYRLPGVSEKTQHRWLDQAGKISLPALKLVATGLDFRLNAPNRTAEREAIGTEIRRVDPTARPESWQSQDDWTRWFRCLWERCQSPLDFLTWDDAAQKCISALLPRRLPVPGKATFQIRLYSERPVWYLLVWLDGRGESRPLGEGISPEQTSDGWQDWDRFQFFRLHGECVLPVNLVRRWELSDETAAETIVLLACQHEPDDTLKSRVRDTFARLPLPWATPAKTSCKGKGKSATAPVQPLQLPRPTEFVLRDMRRAARATAAGRALPMLNAPSTSDPIQAWHEHLRTLLTPCFDRTVILSFANAGTKEGQR